MKIERNDLWKAVREEIKLTMESTGKTPYPQKLDILTDKVIMDEALWQTFNERVLDIIEGKV